MEDWFITRLSTISLTFVLILVLNLRSNGFSQQNQLNLNSETFDFTLGSPSDLSFEYGSYNGEFFKGPLLAWLIDGEPNNGIYDIYKNGSIMRSDTWTTVFELDRFIQHIFLILIFIFVN